MEITPDKWSAKKPSLQRLTTLIPDRSCWPPKLALGDTPLPKSLNRLTKRASSITRLWGRVRGSLRRHGWSTVSLGIQDHQVNSSIHCSSLQGCIRRYGIKL